MEIIKDYFRFITLPQDKANHAMWGLFIYSLLALYDPFIGMLVVMFLGVGKEVLDRFIGGTVDSMDAVATVAPSLFIYVVGILVK